MNIIKISVIIPVFNQEKWIARCLRSLINQNYNSENFEIIVINDGSDDSSEQIINKFIDDIFYIKNKANNGLPNALNQGIKASRGNMIIRVDADDYVNENFLLYLSEFLEQNKYMDAIACDYYLVDKNEEIISRENCMKNPIGCGILFKSIQLFEIGLYDEEFRLNEEKDLRIRFEKKFKIHRLELPLYRYRRHENNITNDKAAIDHHDEKLAKKYK